MSIRAELDTFRAQAQAALNQGTSGWSQGDMDLAETGFAQAALLDPGNPSAHGNLGVVLRRKGKPDAAIVTYRRALALTPHDPATHSNLGNALREAGHYEQAEHHLRFAAQAQPDNRSFAYNLALLVRDRRRHQEARALLQALHEKDPANHDFRWDLALSDLFLKDYRQGFAGYEARWGLARLPTRQLPGPRWMPGDDIKGKKIAIVAEQGFGDALQFARFIPMVAQKGAAIILECLPEQAELFATLPGVIQVVDKHQPLPSYDLWTPIMSLAWLLDITWDTLPAPKSYLKPPKRLAKPLPCPPGATRKVGLIWAGKTSPRDRSWPLERLLPLLEDPRAAFYSMQIGDREADLDRTGAKTLLRDLAPYIHSFADTAAWMDQMDLVITIDTSAAHLAAALGRPTWVLLRYVSDWRWLDEGESCAWYPTMRLFRQADAFDIDGPVRKMRSALDQLLG